MIITSLIPIYQFHVNLTSTDPEKETKSQLKLTANTGLWKLKELCRGGQGANFLFPPETERLPDPPNVRLSRDGNLLSEDALPIE